MQSDDIMVKRHPVNQKSGEMKKADTPDKDKGESTRPARFYETWMFLIFACIAVPIIIRSLFYAPFHIPSGSMKSTLLIGDYIFVSKFAYGYSRYSFPLGLGFFEGRVMSTPPERGDIVVFRMPHDTRIDYIKRLIGFPGDRIQINNGVLILNGRAVAREVMDDFVDTTEDGSVLRIKRYRETLPNGVSYEVLDQYPNGRLDNTGVYVVPEGHYFFMGDNRDNSQDSRVTSAVGYVPEENLVGRADMLFFSSTESVLKFWKWGDILRAQRTLTRLD